ncbi:chitin-binding protein [Hamadaea flava]|uniref:Lytic polysaccharide monooxygenase n=1 Tax=Hamadaea flava TaxID=1742688 RepID=A0ABV8LLB5_9ACTN|nr:lytic polysaccharide monooxygenase [Hamadaea flava]MCP2323726.1 chitin-binding protein [Hamadaea flava]
MRRLIVLPLLAVGALIGSLVVAVSPANAHGYVSSPLSRQAMCAQGRVSASTCGDIIYEPQSVEAPKGSLQCNGGGTRFAVLNDNSVNWPTTSVGGTVTFTWTFTAFHRTTDFEYFVGNTRIAVFSGNNSAPPQGLTHSFSLGGRTGRVTVLARWNIADTINAFYSCVDLQVGGGGTSSPSPSPSVTRTSSPSPSPTTASPSPTATSGSTTWAAGKAYKIGDVVTYNGVSYRCIQAHTALVGWEPPSTPALWSKV